MTAEAGIIAVHRIFVTMQTAQTLLSPETNYDMDVDGNETNATTEINDMSQINQDLALKLVFEQGSVAAFLAGTPLPFTEEDLAPLCITNEDFLLAIKKVQPSSKREGFATVPGVTWDDIGALQSVREELRMAVVEPVKHPEFFERVGINAPVGVLLYGPPGIYY